MEYPPHPTVLAPATEHGTDERLAIEKSNGPNQNLF